MTKACLAAMVTQWNSRQDMVFILMISLLVSRMVTTGRARSSIFSSSHCIFLGSRCSLVIWLQQPFLVLLTTFIHKHYNKKAIASSCWRSNRCSIFHMLLAAPSFPVECSACGCSNSPGTGCSQIAAATGYASVHLVWQRLVLDSASCSFFVGGLNLSDVSNYDPCQAHDKHGRHWRTFDGFIQLKA